MSRFVRQGITLAGVDVVIVAMNAGDAAEVRSITEHAVEQHGPRLLRRSAHPMVGGDRVLTAPVADGDRLLGYVELADG